MNVIMLLKHKDSLKYIYEDNTLRQGLEKMRAHSYTAIPVITRDGKYVGTVSEGDFLWHIIDKISDDILTGYDTDKSTEVIGYGDKVLIHCPCKKLVHTYRNFNRRIKVGTEYITDTKFLSLYIL